jgi:hypothetical protein
MASPAPQEQWVLCPKCHIANIAGGYCTLCGAWLTPDVPEPPYGRSGASPRQWALIISLSAVLIGVPIYAAFSPTRVVDKMVAYGYPVAYGGSALAFAVGAVVLFRKRQFATGITLSMFAILLCLLMMAALNPLIQ